MKAAAGKIKQKKGHLPLFLLLPLRMAGHTGSTTRRFFVFTRM